MVLKLVPLPKQALNISSLWIPKILSFILPAMYATRTLFGYLCRAYRLLIQIAGVSMGDASHATPSTATKLKINKILQICPSLGKLQTDNVWIA
jgi:hypothetical protein